MLLQKKKITERYLVRTTYNVSVQAKHTSRMQSMECSYAQPQASFLTYRHPERNATSGCAEGSKGHINLYD